MVQTQVRHIHVLIKNVFRYNNLLKYSVFHYITEEKNK